MRLPTHLRSLPSLRDVPREIFFEVFALLEAKEDKATLSSCVLVSCLWRDMALRYLWTRITIRTSRPLEAFRGFLQRTSVHRKYVHCLTLRGPVSALYEELDPIPDHLLVPQSVTVLHDIVLSLPKLRHLSLQYIDLSSAPEHTLTPSSPSGIHLDVLELKHVATDCPNPSPVAPLNLMLRTLPLRSLGELKIASTDEDLPSRDPESQDSRTLPIQKVDMTDVDSGNVLAEYYRRLSRCLLPGSLRSLASSVTSDDDLAALVAFLRHARDVTELKIDLQADDCLVSETISTLEEASGLRRHAGHVPRHPLLLSACLAHCSSRGALEQIVP